MSIFAVISVFFMAPSASIPDNAATAQAEPQVAKPKAKKICKNDPRVTGTRISKRICKTEEEWAAKEDGQEVGVVSKTSRSDLDNVGMPTGNPR